MKWDSCEEIVNEQRIQFVENIIGRRLPEIYITCVRNCDQGYPKQSDFEYYNEYHQELWGSGIGCFLALNDSSSTNFLKFFLDPPEFFPEGLVAFADTGGGNFICFDYRAGKDNSDPPIVYWDHGADIGRDVSFIANNFKEFIGMLKEPDDLDQYK